VGASRRQSRWLSLGPVGASEAHVFHLHDGKVVEFWNAATDMYAFDELIG
jgi:hypothetical protein